jgi:hypothetical protein
MGCINANRDYKKPLLSCLFSSSRFAPEQNRKYSRHYNSYIVHSLLRHYPYDPCLA